MAMALAYEHALGHYTTVATSGVGTSQQKEALTLLLCAWQLASQRGIYWVVPDSESAVGALRTYQQGGGGGYAYELTKRADNVVTGYTTSMRRPWVRSA